MRFFRAPIVGIFEARVSRGRTVREFILGVVGVSSLSSFVWVAAYGGTVLQAELFGPGGVSDVVSANVSMALFATLEAMEVRTVGVVAGVLGTIIVTTYFVTSSASGTSVVETILSEGESNPLFRHRVIWGSFQGIIAALPFSVIVVLTCIAIFRCLSRHPSTPELDACEEVA